jgi:protein-S-isoprenylcysteine O-methyltransferase Ste14
MLSELYIAWFVCGCLGVFFALNLYNLLRTKRSRKPTDVYAEVRRPHGFLFALAAFGTLFFFLVSMAYPFLVFAGYSKSEYFPLQLGFRYDFWIQVIGITLVTMGYFLFLWSVLERGRYATSWEMQEDHKLVTSGPYRYVRHPSYLAYFLLFFGLFFLLLNLVALIPLVAIPGYVRITTYEEQLLVARFGSEYVKYQERTGRFLPKMKY